MVYTATVMTENAFYPVFLVTALLLVRMIERPTWRAQVAFLAAVALALLTRAQAIAIVPAALTAPLLLGVFARTGLRAALWPYRLLYALVGAGAALVVAAQIARGRSLSSLLGAYSVVGHQSYGVGKPLRYLVYHLAELDLYLGVIPVAVAIVLVARSRSLDRPLQAFLAVTLALTGWFAVVVATFASQFANRIQERNLFVARAALRRAPACLGRARGPRPRYLAPVAAVASALFVLAIPFETFITTSSVSDTLMLLPWWAVLNKIGIGWVAPLAFLLCALFAAALLFVPRRYAIALPLIVLAYWAVAFKPIWFGPYPYGVKRAGVGALFQGIQGVPRDWIDRAVPTGADVAVLWTGVSDRFTVNQNEFFNRTSARSTTRRPRPPAASDEIRVVADPRTGAVTRRRCSAPAPYLLTDGSVDPNAVPVARDPQLGMTVWKVDGPLVLAKTKKVGLYPGDSWSGPVVTWRREHCRGGSLTVTLTGDARLLPDGSTVTASSGQRIRVIPNTVATLRVPLIAKRGSARPDSSSRRPRFPVT